MQNIVHFSSGHVALSVSSAIAYFALGLYFYVKEMRTSDTPLFIASWTACVFAFGIWCMHFIGMQAYVTPFVVSYDTTRLFISFAIIVLATIPVVHTARQERPHRVFRLLNPTLFGIGIAAMHYYGMTAFIVPAEMRYDRTLFVSSVLYAILIAFVVFYVLNRIVSLKTRFSPRHIPLTAAILGVAASGMHYLGMYALTLTPSYGELNYDLIVDPTLLWVVVATLALAIAVATAIFLIFNDLSDLQKTRFSSLNVLLVCIMALSILGCAMLYQRFYVNRHDDLITEIQNQAYLLDAVARFDAAHSQNAHPKGATYATFDQFIDGRNTAPKKNQSTKISLIKTLDGRPFLIYDDETGALGESHPIVDDHTLAALSRAARNKRIVEYLDFDSVSKKPSLIAIMPLTHIGGGALKGTLPMEQLREPFLATAWRIVLIGIAIALAGSAFMYRISKPIIQQLQFAADSTKKIAEITLNKNAELEAAVKERTMDLEQALILARESAVAKMQFLANMSHEIRTPMNGVLGMLQALLESELGDDQKNMARIAYISAESLLNILNDILHLSKIESGKLELEIIEFDLCETIEDIADLLVSANQQKATDVELTIDIAPEVPRMIRTDPTRIRQIITNLTGNAFKFTTSGEVGIRVRVVAQDGDRLTIRIEISDTGIGIAPQALPKLFQPFTQADNSTTRQFGGTGLGLAISKRLSELLGGTIGVESEPGKGSVFWFTFNAENATVESTGTQNNHVLPGDFRILAVDDNQTNRVILERQLRRLGAQFAIAVNAQEALALAERAHTEGRFFDLVITDFMMPGMNGVKLIETLSSTYGKNRFKSIMLSSAHSSLSKEAAKTLAIDLVLTKPIRQTYLINNIIKLVTTQSFKTAEKVVPIPTTDQEIGPLKILVAEDNEINRKVVTLMLGKLNQTAMMVENGREAVNATSTGDFDVILMDCQMPVLDGYQATREIRSAGLNIPIIAMTANSMIGDEEKCRACGMDDYVVKPLKLEALRNALLKVSTQN